MTSHLSPERLSRLACTLRSVDDADAALLGKLLEAFVLEFRDTGPPSDKVADLLAQPKMFVQADTHPVLTAVTLRLRRRLGDDTCGAWIAKLKFIEERAGVVLLSAPNKFVADHVYSQFGDIFLGAWQAEQSSVVRVEVAAGDRLPTRDSEPFRVCL